MLSWRRLVHYAEQQVCPPLRAIMLSYPEVFFISEKKGCGERRSWGWGREVAHANKSFPSSGARSGPSGGRGASRNIGLIASDGEWAAEGEMEKEEESPPPHTPWTESSPMREGGRQREGRYRTY